MKISLAALTLAASVAMAGLSPALAAGCCGGGGGSMMCGEGKRAPHATGMKSARSKKAACCCEGMAGHRMPPMSRKL